MVVDESRDETGVDAEDQPRAPGEELGGLVDDLNRRLEDRAEVLVGLDFVAEELRGLIDGEEVRAAAPGETPRRLQPAPAVRVEAEMVVHGRRVKLLYGCVVGRGRKKRTARGRCGVGLSREEQVAADSIVSRLSCRRRQTRRASPREPPRSETHPSSRNSPERWRPSASRKCWPSSRRA